MCIGPAFGLIGGLVSAIGSIQAANAQAAVAEYNAEVNRINAQTERRTAQYESDRLEDQYERQRERARAAAAVSGVNPFMGSPSFVIDQEALVEQEADRLATVWNRETRAVGFENEARADEARADAIRTGGIANAFSSILGGFRGISGGGSSGFGASFRIA